MNELKGLLREMLLGDEPVDAARSREALDAALARFDRRMRAARLLFGVGTVLLFAATVWLAVLFVGADPATPVKTLLLYATGIAVLSSGVGTLKGWYFNFHQQTRIMKDLRRLEARLVERAG